MATIATPKVQVLASTGFYGAPLQPMEVDPEASDGAATIEFAGRACYQSFGKPNPATAAAKSYIGHILQMGHGSVLEHTSVTLYITGVSRALTHELIRHRQLSFSELSQRFVNVSDQPVVLPPAIAGDGMAEEVLHEAWDDATDDYEQLVDEIMLSLDPDVTGTARRKAAREAARSVLPQACETRIVVTGNMRAWRDVLLSRGSVHADAEIRRLAVLMYQALASEVPEAFQDFTVTTDGALEAEHGRV